MRVPVLAFAVCLTAFFVFTTTPVQAGPYAPQGPFINPSPGPDVPTPTQVSGKEYSDHLDKNTGGAAAGPLPDPEQVISWDGVGGVQDSFDYTGSRLPNDDNDREVDALANPHDALFFNVQGNTSALLFSVDGYANVHVEKTDGTAGIWATPPAIDQHGVTDVDGLEVWGVEPDGTGTDVPTGDATRYSLENPPPSGDPLGISVWGYNPTAHASYSVWSSFELASAILPLAPAGTELPLIEELLNLDGMMNYGGSDETDPDPNERIIFTIDPILNPQGAVVFDGGEIFYFQRNGGSASFLNHGGHLWDTAFSVSGTFNLASENVNALESVATTAIPLPAAAWLGMLGLGALGIGKLRRKH